MNYRIFWVHHGGPVARERRGEVGVFGGILFHENERTIPRRYLYLCRDYKPTFDVNQRMYSPIPKVIWEKFCEDKICRCVRQVGLLSTALVDS